MFKIVEDNYNVHYQWEYKKYGSYINYSFIYPFIRMFFTIFSLYQKIIYFLKI